MRADRSIKWRVTVIRIFWLALGGLSLALAVLGAALPLLPTTPFLLVAAFAFAKSSARLHVWLVEHPRLGPMIAHWQGEGAIARRTKVLAILAMIAAFTLSLAIGASETVLIAQAIVLVLAGLFVVTRPPPSEDPRD